MKLRVISRCSHRRCSIEKSVLKNFTKACNFIKRETSAQMFPIEFCEIFKKSHDYSQPVGEIFNISWGHPLIHPDWFLEALMSSMKLFVARLL